MDFEQLKLKNQLCFPLYAASRLITKEYQPMLDELGLTYPQYLVLMVLWEHEQLTVNEISQKLILNTNTVTPLLKRMEKMGIVTRQRQTNDERKVTIGLTNKGKDLRVSCASIPLKLLSGLSADENALKELTELKDKIHQLIDFILEKQHHK